MERLQKNYLHIRLEMTGYCNEFLKLPGGYQDRIKNKKYS
jgi:hypothetical protein